QLKRESLQWPVQAEPRRVVTTSQIHGSRTDIRVRVSPPQPRSRGSVARLSRSWALPAALSRQMHRTRPAAKSLAPPNDDSHSPYLPLLFERRRAEACSLLN